MTNMDDSAVELPNPTFTNVHDECAYWKQKCREFATKLTDTKQEFHDFCENSRELEAELETSLEQREKTIRDLKHSLNQIQNDNESLRKKIMNFETDYNTLESKYEHLDKEHERLREHTRKVEQKNDDLERSNRVVSATVSDLETMLNQAYEKNEFLELEVEDKESLSEKHQRVLDELRDLKQEMKVKVSPSSNPAHPAHPPTLHSDNVLNGNTPPIASQKAFTIIADSLRRIDIMAAKLKACQEILPPPHPRPSADTSEVFAQRRMQHLLTAAATKSSPSGLRSSSISNGSMNLSHVSAASLSLSNTNGAEKSILSDSMTTNAVLN